jgi:hypothetical protein
MRLHQGGLRVASSLDRGIGSVDLVRESVAGGLPGKRRARPRSGSSSAHGLAPPRPARSPGPHRGRPARWPRPPPAGLTGLPPPRWPGQGCREMLEAAGGVFDFGVCVLHVITFIPSCWAPHDKSDRVRPGSSCHERKCTRTQGITGNRRRDQPTASPRIRACQDTQVRRHTRTPPPQPHPRPHLCLRGAADCHDQHKPTQPAPGRPIPRTVPYEQNPQVRGHINGSRDRTRTYNLPVNSRTLCRLSYAGSTRIRVAHPRRRRDICPARYLPLTLSSRDEYPRGTGGRSCMHHKRA